MASRFELPLDKEKEYIGRRWKYDPYLIYHSEMMYERGIFQRPDLNVVQIAMLESYKTRHNDLKTKQREIDFLERLFIEDPDRYDAFVKARDQAKQREFDEQMKMHAPKSMDEMREALDDIAALADRIPSSKDESSLDEIDEEWEDEEKTDLEDLARYMR